MPNVKLIAYTPEPQKVCAAAAKLCYSPATIDDLLQDLTDEKVEKFLNMLLAMGHESPIEHVSFTFGAEGVSRSLLAQLTRHRIASYSVKSQRYVNAGKFSYVVPPEIEEDEAAKEIFIRSMEESQRAYDELTERLRDKHYRALMAQGMEEKKAASRAEKMAIEDARFVLPNACETKVIFTMNARSLLHFFELRCCSRAQWEIRILAEQMLWQVKEVAPMLFRTAGPGCVKGACPEGKMSCGKMEEMRAHYLKTAR